MKNSAPCVDCTKKMKELGIKKIIYSDSNGELTACKMSDYYTTKKTTGRRISSSIKI
jgi:deoxycytidylate deaminase